VVEQDTTKSNYGFHDYSIYLCLWFIIFVGPLGIVFIFLLLLFFTFTVIVCFWLLYLILHCYWIWDVSSSRLGSCTLAGNSDNICTTLTTGLRNALIFPSLPKFQNYFWFHLLLSAGLFAKLRSSPSTSKKSRTVSSGERYSWTWRRCADTRSTGAGGLAMQPASSVCAP